VRGSIFDVARASGVSIGTVSRAFNNRPDVAPSTRKLVLEAARKVHYEPRSCARRLGIGLLIEDMSKATEVGYVGTIISSVTKAVAACGGVVELVSTDDVESIYARHMSGVVAVLFGPDTAPLEKIDSAPVVLINNVVEGSNFHTVASDHAQGVRIAMEHLLRLGHRRIGFMEMVEGTWASRERQRGYAEALRGAGVPFDPALVRFARRSNDYQELAELLALRPTALIACGEDLSLAVSNHLLHAFGVTIPDDLSVISYEVPIVTELLSPPQTAVAQPWSEISREAMDLICDVVEERISGRQVRLLENELIERRSVRAFTGISA
jgi:DNA-binding LacI/PurR family transcriptional regulator